MNIALHNIHVAKIRNLGKTAKKKSLADFVIFE